SGRFQRRPQHQGSASGSGRGRRVDLELGPQNAPIVENGSMHRFPPLPPPRRHRDSYASTTLHRTNCYSPSDTSVYYNINTTPWLKHATPQQCRRTEITETGMPFATDDMQGSRYVLPYIAHRAASHLPASGTPPSHAGVSRRKSARPSVAVWSRH